MLVGQVQMAMRKRGMMVYFFDLKKAYDTVDREKCWTVWSTCD